MLATDVEYHLQIIRPNGTLLIVDEFLDNLTWEEYEGQLAMRLGADLKNQRVGGKRIAQHLSNGTEIRLRSPATSPGTDPELFRGRVFRNRTSASGGISRHIVTAYDPLFYLTGSRDDRYYKGGMTATEIIKDIAKAWKIPTRFKGETPTTKLSKKTFKGRLLSEMVAAVLRETQRKNGGRWLLQAHKGKLELVRRGSNRHIWYFEADNTSEITVERSMENLLTRVRIVGRNKKGSKVLATATSELAPQIGILQDIVDRSAYNSPGAAEKAAKRMLRSRAEETKTRTFLAPDVPEIRRGHRVHLEAATLRGFYIVQSVSHDGSNRTMALTITRRDPDDVDINFRESGLDTWIPPEDRDPAGHKGGISGEGFQWPAKGTVTSEFGDDRPGNRTHAGIDIANSVGTAVWASKAGKVTFAGTASGYGNVVYIRHANGWETRYAHLSRINVKAGQKVERGDTVGLMGSTGTSTGSHLHFETRKDTQAIDPRRVLP